MIRPPRKDLRLRQAGNVGREMTARDLQERALDELEWSQGGGSWVLGMRKPTRFRRHETIQECIELGGGRGLDILSRDRG